MPRGKNRCAICNQKHDQKHNFPDDYPYKLRFCCSCRGFSVQIILQGIDKVEEWLNKYDYLSFTGRRSLIKRAKKINKAITFA